MSSPGVPPQSDECPFVVLSSSQIGVMDLFTEISRDLPYTTLEFDTSADPAETRRAVAALSVGKLLVAPGGELAADPKQHQGYNLPSITPGKAGTELTGLTFGGWGMHNKRQRRLPTAEAQALTYIADRYKLDWGDGTSRVEFPGQFDWNGYVHATFWYGRMGERLAVASNHSRPGELPTITSYAVIPFSDSPGASRIQYTRLERLAQSDEEALAFLALIRSLHSKRTRLT